MWSTIGSEAFDVLLDTMGVSSTGCGKSKKGIRWSQFSNPDKSIVLRIEMGPRGESRQQARRAGHE